MKFNELPQEVQERLTKERLQLHAKGLNTAYRVEAYNEQGTRFFMAYRCSRSWNDDKGHYMPFGGGTYWRVSFGKMAFEKRRDPLGGYTYELAKGITFARSANGTDIPQMLETKKEVLEVMKKIGIF